MLQNQYLYLWHKSTLALATTKRARCERVLQVRITDKQERD